MQASVISARAAGTRSATQKDVVVFVCVNCARAGAAPSAVRSRPALPVFDWPMPVEEIPVPCAGRLQPEHILKAFEAGASFVGVIACQDDNCHYAEGCLRARRRVEHVGDLLEQIGLGGERLALFQLPGSAREDLAAGERAAEIEAVPAAELARRVRAIRDDITARVKRLFPNPLYKVQEPEEESSLEETESNED